MKFSIEVFREHIYKQTRVILKHVFGYHRNSFMTIHGVHDVRTGDVHTTYKCTSGHEVIIKVA